MCPYMTYLPNFQNNPLNRLTFNSYAKESGNEDYSLWDISVGGGGRGSRSRGKKGDNGGWRREAGKQDKEIKLTEQVVLKEKLGVGTIPPLSSLAQVGPKTDEKKKKVCCKVVSFT